MKRILMTIGLISLFFIYIIIQVRYFFFTQVPVIENNKLNCFKKDTIYPNEIHTYLNCNFSIHTLKVTNHMFYINGLMPIDLNHDFPGVGPINVVFFIYTNSMNIKNSMISFDIISEDSIENLHFWVQSKLSKRSVNYMTKRPISNFISNVSYDFMGKKFTIKIPINKKTQFDCLGTSFLKRRVYGCDVSLQEVLENVNIDFGLIRILKDNNDDCKKVNLKISNFCIYAL